MPVHKILHQHSVGNQRILNKCTFKTLSKPDAQFYTFDLTFHPIEMVQKRCSYLVHKVCLTLGRGGLQSKIWRREGMAISYLLSRTQ